MVKLTIPCEVLEVHIPEALPQLLKTRTILPGMLKKPPAAFSPLCPAHVLHVRSARQKGCGLAGRTPRLRGDMLFEYSLPLMMSVSLRGCRGHRRVIFNGPLFEIDCSRKVCYLSPLPHFTPNLIKEGVVCDHHWCSPIARTPSPKSRSTSHS